ncbi:SipW-dependent-type signal peptide-containing protein [Pseudactinotalea suaedae]|uniref:SipW-dependent-type signal peptide-containing protein n=1 Tax=Pseudactinotalea suaedae TaxID=1524924 RepID=UPI0012E30CED|nr:SipW-dependent-type signal peptide-containing protein [Pseudactinotalea suaedae]
MSRKVRALLAGGVVLGIGAAATLAAWNDSEFATGTFSSGVFNLQGSTEGAAEGYADHAAADGAAALGFSAGFDNLSPGDVTYAPFWVRLDAGTTAPATLDLVAIDSTDTTGTNSGQLGYSVYAIDAAADCDETATGGTLLGTATTLADDAEIAGGTTALPVGDPTTEPGAATQLCFIVTAAAGLGQGGETTATWQLTATTD